jgi:hypothetical protein
VPLGIDGVAAELAAGPTRGGDGRSSPGQGEHLLPARPDPDAIGLPTGWKAGDVELLLDGGLTLPLLLRFGNKLLELEQHAVAVLLVADGQPPHPPSGIEGSMRDRMSRIDAARSSTCCFSTVTVITFVPATACR